MLVLHLVCDRGRDHWRVGVRVGSLLLYKNFDMDTCAVRVESQSLSLQDNVQLELVKNNTENCRAGEAVVGA